ncbi:MAG: hypothetical protein JWM92_376 [Candidatus Nomurabacteria bacterium]|jgi:hypothetical protein|nr:hypothetical protein [Candidatus Nomurabacteria bacterium]
MKLAKLKLSLLFSIVALLAVFVTVKIVQADISHNAYGYAWSANIGWISFNDCTNLADNSTCTPSASYGVNILPAAPGTITGYAWSSNVGWITFNDPSCPTSGCTPGAYVDWNNSSNGAAKIKGWARVCSVYQNGCSGALKSSAYLGTWDGYIALDANTAGGSGNSWGWQISNSTNTISGYAWGSQVLGWIKSISAAVYLGGPTVQIVGNPATITSGQSTTLTVTASNIDGAGSCAISGVSGLIMTQTSASNWTGSVGAKPTQTTTYHVACTKGNQQGVAAAVVHVIYFTTPTTCTNQYPQFAWDTDAVSCSISEQGGGSLNAGISSQERGGTQGSDGLYYYTANLPVNGTTTNYTLQCNGGANPINITIPVTSCQKDFLLSVTPTSQTFVAGSGANAGKMIATYTVSAVPQSGFTDPITLSVQSWPTAIPGSKQGSFDTTTLTSSSGGAYNTAQLTISIDVADFVQGTTYSPVVIQGADGNLIRTAKVSVGSNVKLKPIFNEF